MISRGADLIICCNGATAPANSKVCTLEYDPRSDDRNVTLGLPTFVESVNHIPDRILDLLEIAAYVFAADRLNSRGRKDQVEYHAWSRRWLFRMRVRDHAFWAQSAVCHALQGALKQMTGDADYQFEFISGHRTPLTNLFDTEDFNVPSRGSVQVALFSGGLDSLAGALNALDETSHNLILVSHESQTGTIRTQEQLVDLLKATYPQRVSHYSFRCHLNGERGIEETQRTRSFLYCSIGFAISRSYCLDELKVYENGVTSINLRRREDLANARASRTTHPKTVELLSRLLSMVAEREFRISLPFLWKTKTDVVAILRDTGHENLIASSVSCSRTYQQLANATHCGTCFQCVDRRIAIHAADAVEADDPALYASDVFRDPIDGEARTTAIDYVRQAAGIANSNVDHFFGNYLLELSDVIGAIHHPSSEYERREKVWELMSRHASSVRDGLTRATELYDDPFDSREPKSLLGLIGIREHLKDEIEHCVASLVTVLIVPLAEIWAKKRPQNEGELNTHVGAILRSHRPQVQSENPTVSFAGAKVVPDHELIDNDILIEAKYIRGNTAPSRASEGIAADLVKYPQSAHILFLVYDPDRAIANDARFIGDFQNHGRCTVQLIR